MYHWRQSPYPGRGPWSWLPPWLRPGWLFGGCWRIYSEAPPPLWWPSKEDELRYLEELKRQIENRIEELRREIGKQ